MFDSSSPYFAAACLLAQLGSAAPARCQGELGDAFATRLDVTAVEILLRVRDADGHLPEDLVMEDLEVLEDGVAQPVIGLDTPWRSATPRVHSAQAQAGSARFRDAVDGVARDWLIVIYLDEAMSSRRSIRSAARSLAEQADRLTELGRVEVVSAASTIEVLQPATRKAEQLRDTLLRAGRKNPGREAVAQLRRRYLQGLDDRLAAEAGNRGPVRGSRVPAPGGSGGGPPGLEPPRRGLNDEHDSSRRMQIRSTLQQEVAIVDQHWRLLLEHLASHGARGPRALFLVSDGFDMNPLDFYLAGVPEGIRAGLNAELLEASFSPITDRSSHALAADGWTTVTLALGDLQAHAAGAASERGRSISQAFQAGKQPPSESVPRFLLSAPLEPLARLAEDTGGDLVTDSQTVAAAVSRLRDRVVLTYQTTRSPGGEARRIEVRSRRPGFVVDAPRWVGGTTPDAIALSRARQIAQGRSMGDLPLEAMVLFDSTDGADWRATIAARVALSPLDGVRGSLRTASLQVTTAIYFADREPFVHRSIRAGQDLSGGDNWGCTTRMSLLKDVAVVVVLIEELETGSWGGGIAPLVRPRREVVE